MGLQVAVRVQLSLPCCHSCDSFFESVCTSLERTARRNLEVCVAERFWRLNWILVMRGIIYFRDTILKIYFERLLPLDSWSFNYFKLYIYHSDRTRKIRWTLLYLSDVDRDKNYFYRFIWFDTRSDRTDSPVRSWFPGNTLQRDSFVRVDGKDTSSFVPGGLSRIIF